MNIFRRAGFRVFGSGKRAFHTYEQNELKDSTTREVCKSLLTFGSLILGGVNVFNIGKITLHQINRNKDELSEEDKIVREMQKRLDREYEIVEQSKREIEIKRYRRCVAEKKAEEEEYERREKNMKGRI